VGGQYVVLAECKKPAAVAAGFLMKFLGFLLWP
jgi:hypothetical protein